MYGRVYIQMDGHLRLASTLTSRPKNLATLLGRLRRVDLKYNIRVLVSTTHADAG